MGPAEFKANNDYREGSDSEPSSLVEQRIGRWGMVLLFLFLFLAKCCTKY